MERIYKNKTDILIILVIVLLATTTRLFLLNSVPTNISGDEVTNLSNIYMILFGHKNYLLSFMGDGSVAGIVFYWPAFLIKLLGLNNTIFALRVSFSIFSIFSLIPFYLILRSKTSVLISIIFTALLSANYVFLNFSRTAWINMISIFSGLFLILFIEKATKEKNNIYYIIAGIFAGIGFYGYHYGRVLIIVVSIYLLRIFIINGLRTRELKGPIIFLLATLLICLPFIINIVRDNGASLLRRPQATFVFSQEKTPTDPGATKNLFYHQLDYTFRGLLLFDKSVMSEGTENNRYLPYHTSPINPVIEILFFGGLLLTILRRKYLIWLLVLISILIVELITDNPPNYSRGLFYIPVIYFFSAIFSSKLLMYARKFSTIRRNIVVVYIFILVAGAAIFYNDVRLYFSWMGEKYEYNARQPAITYQEFDVWQKYQIKRVKTGQLPVTNYEWYQLRPFFLPE